MKYLRLLSVVLPFFLLSLTVFFSACTKKTEPVVTSRPLRQGGSPDDVVKQFVDLSAKVSEDRDREKLQDLCSGEMRRTFERMTPEAFRIAYINSHVKVTSMKVLDNAIEGDNAKVRYQVIVENNSGTDPTRETNERVVELTHLQGAWYIESIRPEGSDKIAFTRGMIF